VLHHLLSRQGTSVARDSCHAPERAACSLSAGQLMAVVSGVVAPCFPVGCSYSYPSADWTGSSGLGWQSKRNLVAEPMEMARAATMAPAME